jgi:olfactory receptor
LIFVSVCVFDSIALSGISFSYNNVVSSVLRMPSAAGIYKALSTCASHLSVIVLLFLTAFCVYISPASTDSVRKTALASVMHFVVPQKMNPFIYSLRNRDMKESLRKPISRIPPP